ncbi:MAG: hypothetical protein H0V53_10960 [Rubrobacter sp.]|jgi:hypothetical protein|nr:hypothetical protein [Rubrobacter sp.]
MSERGVPEEPGRDASGFEVTGADFSWDAAEDLTAFSRKELEEHLKTFAGEERAISYRRRLLQGRIDLIRAELVRRGGSTLSPEQLARVLLGEIPSERSDPEGGREQ